MIAAASTFIPSGRDLLALQSETALVCGVVAMLLAPFFSVKRSNILSALIALGVMFVALLLSLRGIESGPAMRGLLVLDPASVYWEQVLLVFMIGLVLMWFSSTRPALRDGDGPEFFTLLLASTAGMMLMGGTSHLLMLLLATELASMPSYVLAGFRKRSRASAEAALKFVLFGAVCTAVMIYGLSLLYGTHGTLSVDAIARDLATRQAVPYTTMIGLLALFAGLLFKISGFPMHFWAPDVLEGAYADIAAFLSVASKGAGLVLLARVATTLAPAHTQLAYGIAIAIGVASVLSMVVGNLGALHQTSLKRLLAYSSIAHAGYMMGAVALVVPGKIDDAMSVLGLYLAIYLFMQLGAFAVVGDIETRRGDDRIASVRGLASLAPLSAAGLAIAMLSMIGLPPFAGLWAKLKVMIVLASVGGWWWVLVVSIGVNSIISIGFYGRVLRAMYLEKPDADHPPHRLDAGGLVAVACAVALVGTFIFLAPLERTAERMSQQHRDLTVDK